MTTTFDQLGLSQPVLQALDLKGYNNPTPIQEQAIPAVLKGRDLLGIAQTGTGKTAAFMLPSIDRLREAGRQTPFKSCRMLVLAPTRELAGQIAQSAKDYGALAGLKVQSIVGGTSVNKDRNKLHRGTDILVATPGRLLDLIDQKAFGLGSVEVLVLDEADQMLDLGFIHALRKISQLVPADRQTLFFSATMPKAIKDLVGQYCKDPVHVSVTPAATTAERIDQYLFMVQQDEKQSLIEMILQGRHQVPGKIERVLVFTRTKHGADRVVKKLAQVGGIDIPGVSHVINYELPTVPEQYVHRIGRTARAGADGIAIAFCAEDERSYLKDIRKTTDAEFERLALPENFRAGVEGVGPTKPAPKQQRGQVRVTPRGGSRPDAGEQRRDKPQSKSGRKHPNRAGKPHGAGKSHAANPQQGERSGDGGRSQRRRRRSGGRPQG